MSSPLRLSSLRKWGRKPPNCWRTLRSPRAPRWWPNASAPCWPGSSPACWARPLHSRTGDGRVSFISPGGNRADIDARQKFLSSQADKAKYLSYDRERFERRRARLDGRWCQIELVGATPQETAMLMDRGRAAVANMQSSLRHGAVAGGASAFSELALRLARPLRHRYRPLRPPDASALPCVQFLTKWRQITAPPLPPTPRMSPSRTRCCDKRHHRPSS